MMIANMLVKIDNITKHIKNILDLRNKKVK